MISEYRKGIMKIRNSSAYCSSLIIRSTRFVMLSAALAFGSQSAIASSVPMLFDFDHASLSGTFSYDSESGIEFESTYPGITAYTVDSLHVDYAPSDIILASWNLGDAVDLGTGNRVSVFFDTANNVAIGKTDDNGPPNDSVSVMFKDSTNSILNFSFSIDDSSIPNLIVSGTTLRARVTDKVSDPTLTITSPYTVTAVPIPAAAWLFGSGLIGLIGVARRKA